MADLYILGQDEAIGLQWMLQTLEERGRIFESNRFATEKVLILLSKIVDEKRHVLNPLFLSQLCELFVDTVDREFLETLLMDGFTSNFTFLCSFHIGGWSTPLP